MGRKWMPVVLLAVAAAIATAGCPDSDPLNTGTYEFTIQLDAVNDSGWDCVLMDVNSLQVKPVDGICSNTGDPCFNDVDCGGEECDGALANDSIIGSNVEIITGTALAGANFSDPGEPCDALDTTGTAVGVTAPLQFLSRGRYKITTLQIARPSLVNDDGTVRACDSFAANLSNLAPYQGDLVFTIGEDEPNSVRLILDAQALEAAHSSGCVFEDPAIDEVLTLE